MTVSVHPTAVVEAGACLERGVTVGPLCHVGARVYIESGTELLAQVSIWGPCRLGKNNRVLPFAVLGAPPQDRSFSGEETELVIGDDNVFREHVTVHRGTGRGGGVTRVGSRNLFMVGAHVAHDCSVGNDVVLTNYVSLGGHVRVGDGAVCGGHVAVAPFVRLGDLCFVAGGSLVERDVPPYLVVAGDRARVRSVNRVGLERAGVPLESRRALRRAYWMLYRGSAPIDQAVQAARAELGGDPHVALLLDCVERSAGRRARR